MVGKDHDTREKRQVHNNDGEGNIGFLGIIRFHAFGFFHQFMAENPGHDRCVNYDGNGGFPAKMGQHERRIPAPGRSNHQYGRCGKVCQRAADRDIDEEDANRCIAQA